ncbi:MAG: FAD-dependent oxidoreductase [Methylobacteriaceae bacterium]|nr:FAD-dependent oxidoreductase [Methylobacteriaceae bacterium]
MSLHSVVIAGAGQAGFQTAASLRQDGYDGRITLVGDEPGLPYQRPPLSKAYLMGKTSAEALCFRPEKFFADNKIEVVAPTRVTAIDRTNRRVALASGGALEYDHLVLALGAHNRTLPIPGADFEGVFGLRTLADADAIGAMLADAQEVVVAGAGFIGLEFAAVASVLGKSVHVLELADRPMARAVSPAMSDLFADAHSSWGVKIDFGQGLAGILGEAGRVASVETTDGRKRPADIVVFGIGVLPNVAIAAEAGLDIDNGIKVDADLLTSDPAISAIGDCASFPSPHAASHIRLESVQNAADQSRAVAARLMGKVAPYAAVPWFWSDQRDLKLQIAGLSSGCDHTVIIGNADERRMSVLCFRRDKLIAVESVNRGSDHVAARKIFGRGMPALAAAEASKPGFDLKAWEAATR